jgi:DNA-binding CsgD family transcriptional regulator
MGRRKHPEPLTPAEQRVLDEIRAGGTNAEIAVRLGLSVNTVKYHVANMFSKLDLSDRQQLASWSPVSPWRSHLSWVLAGGATFAAAVAVIVVVLAARGPDKPERHLWWFEASPAQPLAKGLLIKDVLQGREFEVTPDPGTLFAYPTWSPDGARLAALQISDPAEGGTLRLWAPPDKPVAEFKFSGLLDDQIWWAPDGKRLAFLTDELMLVDADGKLVAHAAAAAVPHQGNQISSIAVWSPDSRFLALVRDGVLVVVGVDGSARRLSLIDAGIAGKDATFGLTNWRDGNHIQIVQSINRTPQLFELTLTASGIDAAKSNEPIPSLTAIPVDTEAALQTQMPNMVFKGAGVSADGRGRAYIFHKPYPIPGEVRPATVYIQVGSQQFTFQTHSEVDFRPAPVPAAAFVVVGDWPP